MNPFDSLNNVSVCAVKGTGVTSNGLTGVLPVFKFIIFPLIKVTNVLASEAGPTDDKLKAPVVFKVTNPKADVK